MKIKIYLGLLSVFLGAMLLTTSSAHAVSGDCYFPAGAGPVGSGGVCSEEGLGDYGINDILTGRDINGNGQAIPASVNSKPEFINFIVGRFHSDNVQDRIGAAFIIQEMRGSHAWPNDANIDDWIARMQQASVSVSKVWDGSVGRTSWYDNDKGNTFYGDHPNVGRMVMVVRQDGRVKAKIEVLCGNMVAGAVPIELRTNWEAIPKSSADKPVVKPGGNVHWDHSIKNMGPDNTSEPIYWEIKQFKKENGAPNEVGVTIASDTIGKNRAKGDILLRTKGYLNVPASDLGKRICQYIRFKPYAVVNNDVKDSSFRSSNPVCVPVKQNIVGGDFVPSAAVDRDFAEPNTQYGWKASVTDGFIPLSQHPHPPEPQNESTITWEVREIVYPPDNTSSYAGGTGPFVCPVAPGDCSIKNGAMHAHKHPGGSVFFPGPGEDDWKMETVPDNLASGTRICYVSSVKLPKELDPQLYRHWYDNYYWEQTGTDSNGDPIYGWVNHPYYEDETVYKDESTRQWRHSTEECVTVAKRPRVQIRGEDVAVRGNIITGVSTYKDDGKTFGSWVEYGAFSLGENEFSASGAAYNEGSASDRSAWSKLTFANKNDDASYGNFGSIPEPPKIAEYYASKVTGPWNGSILGDGGIFSAGSTSVSGTGVSKPYVIYSSGDVTIDHNIEYSNGPFDSAARLPQVIIIAKKIKITGNVTKVDAWLITTVNGVDHGSINTCSDLGDRVPLADNDCKLPLVVNGPVVTGSLYLRRTYGAKPFIDRGAPAEIFRLRPDAFIWGYGQSSSDSVAQTVDISELPPRF
jgi:hypothetical protein